jgi:hypothetical protein
MKRLSGLIVSGGLLLGNGPASEAQVTMGRPACGPQPAYGRSTSPYGQPGYIPPGSTQPAPTQPSGMPYRRGYGAPAYPSPYRTRPAYGGYVPHAQPSYGSGTGVIVDGRSSMLPR